MSSSKPPLSWQQLVQQMEEPTPTMQESDSESPTAPGLACVVRSSDEEFNDTTSVDKLTEWLAEDPQSMLTKQRVHAHGRNAQFGIVCTVHVAARCRLSVEARRNITGGVMHHESRAALQEIEDAAKRDSFWRDQLLCVPDDSVHRSGPQPFCELSAAFKSHTPLSTIDLTSDDDDREDPQTANMHTVCHNKWSDVPQSVHLLLVRPRSLKHVCVRERVMP
jgi:hypothetical protein